MKIVEFTLFLAPDAHSHIYRDISHGINPVFSESFDCYYHYVTDSYDNTTELHIFLTEMSLTKHVLGIGKFLIFHSFCD